MEAIETKILLSGRRGETGCFSNHTRNGQVFDRERKGD
jgi:hypothetical protein